MLTAGFLLLLTPSAFGLHSIMGWSPSLIGMALMLGATPLLIAGAVLRRRYRRERLGTP